MSLRQDQQQRRYNNCKGANNVSEWVTGDSNISIGLKNKPDNIRVNVGT